MIDALKDRTYMVRHNPNCPKRFEVRLTGMALLISMSDRAPQMKEDDAVGYGDTADEAAANAIAVEQQRRAVIVPEAPPPPPMPTSQFGHRPWRLGT